MGIPTVRALRAYKLAPWPKLNEFIPDEWKGKAEELSKVNSPPVSYLPEFGRYLGSRNERFAEEFFQQDASSWADYPHYADCRSGLEKLDRMVIMSVDLPHREADWFYRDGTRTDAGWSYSERTEFGRLPEDLKNISKICKL